MHLVIIGGGAAGFFAALLAKELHPTLPVTIVEKTKQPLAKVRISGGGRCNVTHACFEVEKLVKHYPRGEKELRGPFSRFQPKDTIRWFEERGVLLKTEEDGRMFPVTDSSETIINCLLKQAEKLGVHLLTETSVEDITPCDKGFSLALSQNKTLTCSHLLVASGSNRPIFELLTKLGHTIEPLIPSLFTFNLPSSPLLDLAGISVGHVRAKIQKTPYVYEGPLLLTHWGFSGPCILKLSAWGAKELFASHYKATCEINWLPHLKREEIIQTLQEARLKMGAKEIAGTALFDMPKKLWKRLLEVVGISDDMRFLSLSNTKINEIASKLQQDLYAIDGKTTNKQEFVTCGGVSLKEVNFKTMESKKIPHLYFAGEVLDIDGITGGFNFQNAWTTAFIAASQIALESQETS
jgi:predicted Rossmann fold flavoprotein